MILENNVCFYNRVFESLKGKQNIVVWGCGETTVKLMELTQLSRYEIQHYVDNGRMGRAFFGKDIKSSNMICWEKVDGVVISAVNYTEEINKELTEVWAYRGDIISINKKAGIRQFYQYAPECQYQYGISELQKELLMKNGKYKDIHLGERVFILCCGPSINELDLKKLGNEKSIAVSDFFVHQDYEKIAPEYYCKPKLEDYYASEDLVSWQKQFKKHVGKSQMFFEIGDYDLFYKSGILPREQLNFLSTKACDLNFAEIDLEKNVMSPQSVSIMAIQIALYMGFSEIYLLGVEHDSIVTKKYEHFFDARESIFTINEDSVDENNNIILPFQMELEIQNRLWKQYGIMKEIAEKKNAAIYNATPGGILDVFERVKFEEILGA